MKIITNRIPLLFNHFDNEYIDKRISELPNNLKIQTIILGAIKSLCNSKIISGKPPSFTPEGWSIYKRLSETFSYTQDEYDTEHEYLFGENTEPIYGI